MAETETELRFSQPRSHFGTWVGVMLLFAVFGLFVWTVMGVMPRRDNYEEKRGEKRIENLKKYHEEVDPQLNGYAWVDKAKGTVRVPVHRAMELAIADLAQKKPTAANPLPPEGDKAGLQVTAPVAPTPMPGASSQGSARPTPATATEGKDSENAGQAAASANPPNAAPGTQPGANATPAAAPVSTSNQPNVGPGKPTATPVQSSAGTPLPVQGATPGAVPSASPTPTPR
ncbi:MAG: hypothetical protein M3Y69_07855 [Verrucomicrobiota bacterium]|nr:hypothetical protein [Verrucomicrobiota bacterium]